ncbi:MAG: hypothetical protein ACOCVK_00445, partial [bacterium]
TTVAALVSVVVLMFGRTDVSEHMTLEGRATVDGGRVIVSGSTSLPDGALLEVTVRDPEGGLIPAEDPILVRHGSFAASIAMPEGVHAAIDTDSSDVLVTFEIVMEDRSQPSELIERFGGIGQRMTADETAQTGHGRRLIWRLPLEDRP